MARAGVVDIQLKKMFLDRKLVEDIMGKKSAKALRIALSRVRKRAQHSMKTKGAARRRPKRDKGKAFDRWMLEVTQQPASPPGTPPFVHSTSSVETLRNIWFGVEFTSGTVQGIVGPLALNKMQKLNGVVARGTVPRLHEKGGTATIREKRVGKSWHPIGRRVRPGQPVRSRQATYPKRPFMLPALQAEAPKLPKLWTGAAV